MLWLLMLPLGITSLGLQRTHVRITNILQDFLDLTLQCKSDDEDLGVQHLKPDESFEIQFRPTFLTTYSCIFQWEGACHWFDIYSQERDNINLCKYCNWNIFKSGPCRHASGEEPSF